MADTFVATSLAQEPAHARKKLITPRRFYYVTIFALFVIALVLRFLHVFYVFYSPVSDMVKYIEYSQRIFRLPFRPAELVDTIVWPPGYPFWLWVTNGLLGLPLLKGVLYLQALINALAVFPLSAASRRLFGPKTAVVAGVLYAIYEPFIYTSALLLSETLVVPVIILFIYFWYELIRSLLAKNC